MDEERWPALFEDLEQQFAAGAQARDDDLLRERERVRVAATTLRERLVALTEHDVVRVEGDPPVHGEVVGVGADWFVVDEGTASGVAVIPIAAVRSIVLPDRRTPNTATGDPLAARMTLGFVLRGLARRRVACLVRAVGDRAYAGTIASVGADFLDLAVHDLDQPPRTGAVREIRTIPLTSIGLVRLRQGARV